MGCFSLPQVKEEKPPEEENKNFFETKEEEVVVKKITEKQNEIIDKFNKKQGNSKNVGLSNISSCYIKFRNSSTGTKYTMEAKAENILKFLENINPFNEEIKLNKDVNNLQTELYETEMYYSNIIKPKSKNLLIKSTQKIHNKYNLVLKLKNIKTNQSKNFDFNNLNKPLLIIFFDVLSEKALDKIKEFKIKEIELSDNENKNFILLPIINIFVDKLYSDINSSTVFTFPDLLKYGIIVFLQI